MEVKTELGKTYTVVSEAGCTVSTAEGKLIKEIAAGQDYFTAISGKTVISDDEAECVEVFKSAPCQFGLMGGSPAWVLGLNALLANLLDGTQFKTAWLAGDKTLVVHTDRVDDELLEAVRTTVESLMPDGATLVLYNHHIEVSWRDWNKYAACKTIADLRAVNPDYKSDVTKSGVWDYNLAGLTGRIGVQNIAGMGSVYFMDSGKNLKKIFINAPNVSELGYVVYNTNEVEELEIKAENAPRLRTIVENSKYLKKVRIYAPKATELIDVLRCWDDTELQIDVVADWQNLTTISGFHCYMPSWNIPLPKLKNIEWGFGNNSLVLFDSDLPSLENATNGFLLARLNAASVLRICNSIPAWQDGATHKLGLGIHDDLQNDAKVLAAIDAAAAKGWTVTVQYNKTATT